jgi:nickel/cobalt transporter (NicO) family protein
MPTADSVQGVWSWRRAAILALGIGIRPCTGAIGVLFVANGLGLMWAGVLSTFAMAIGTAITVSALAALAVSSRDLATRIAGAADNSWASIAQTVIGLTGAALVFILGSTFFYYSFGTPAPF